MLDNMQAAEQRRLEVQQAQRARLSAKSELVMSRLVGARDILISCTAEEFRPYVLYASVTAGPLPGSSILRASTPAGYPRVTCRLCVLAPCICCSYAYNIIAVPQANCQAADKARRQQLLTQLLGRLANTEQQRQAACAQRGTGVAKRSGSRPCRSSSSSGLKRLVAVRGLEDWMQVRQRARTACDLHGVRVQFRHWAGACASAVCLKAVL